MLSETLFSTLLLVSVYGVLNCVTSGSTWSAWTSAAAIAGATYTRPVAIFLPFVIAPIFVLGSRKGVVRGASIAGSFLLVVAVITGPWIIRNHRRADYAGFSSISDVALYFYQGAAVTAEKTGTPFSVQQRDLGYFDRETYFAAHPEQRDWTAGRIYKFQRTAGIRTIAENPTTYAKIHVRGILRALLNPGAEGFFVLFGRGTPDLTDRLLDQGWLAATYSMLAAHPFLSAARSALLAWQLVLLALAAWGLRTMPRTASSLAITLVGLYLVITSGGPHGTTRFRHGIMPLVCVLAAKGLCGAWSPADAAAAGRPRSRRS